MIIKRALQMKTLSNDLTVAIVALLMCVFLWFRPVESEEWGAVGHWVGIITQTFFAVAALVLFNRLRNKGGAAALFVLGLYFVPDYLPALPALARVYLVFLGPFFWMLLIVVCVKLLETASTTGAVVVEDNREIDDEIVELGLGK